MRLACALAGHWSSHGTGGMAALDIGALVRRWWRGLTGNRRWTATMACSVDGDSTRLDGLDGDWLYDTGDLRVRSTEGVSGSELGCGRDHQEGCTHRHGIGTWTGGKLDCGGCDGLRWSVREGEWQRSELTWKTNDGVRTGAIVAARVLHPVEW
jgi:hypothetical protein